METINAALISIPTAYLFGGMVVALILYKAVPKSLIPRRWRPPSQFFTTSKKQLQ